MRKHKHLFFFIIIYWVESCGIKIINETKNEWLDCRMNESVEMARMESWTSVPDMSEFFNAIHYIIRPSILKFIIFNFVDHWIFSRNSLSSPTTLSSTIYKTRNHDSGTPTFHLILIISRRSHWPRTTCERKMSQINFCRWTSCKCYSFTNKLSKNQEVKNNLENSESYSDNLLALWWFFTCSDWYFLWVRSCCSIISIIIS